MYSEEKIRAAAKEIKAAGMDKYMYQEPRSERKRRCSNSCSPSHHRSRHSYGCSSSYYISRTCITWKISRSWTTCHRSSHKSCHCSSQRSSHKSCHCSSQRSSHKSCHCSSHKSRPKPPKPPKPPKKSHKSRHSCHKSSSRGSRQKSKWAYGSRYKGRGYRRTS